jgi:hypothetical protein
MFMKSPLLSLKALFLFVSLVKGFKWPFPLLLFLPVGKVLVPLALWIPLLPVPHSSSSNELISNHIELPISQLEKDAVFQSLGGDIRLQLSSSLWTNSHRFDGKL